MKSRKYSPEGMGKCFFILQKHVKATIGNLKKKKHLQKTLLGVKFMAVSQHHLDIILVSVVSSEVVLGD